MCNPRSTRNANGVKKVLYTTWPQNGTRTQKKTWCAWVAFPPAVGDPERGPLPQPASPPRPFAAFHPLPPHGRGSQRARVFDDPGQGETVEITAVSTAAAAAAAGGYRDDGEGSGVRARECEDTQKYTGVITREGVERKYRGACGKGRYRRGVGKGVEIPGIGLFQKTGTSTRQRHRRERDGHKRHTRDG